MNTVPFRQYVSQTKEKIPMIPNTLFPKKQIEHMIEQKCLETSLKKISMGKQIQTDPAN